MAIDKDTAATLRAQIEHIRSAQIIPDIKAEVQEGGEAYPARWGYRDHEKEEHEYVSYITLNDAMSPLFPKGELAIARITGARTPDPKDGDIVVASLGVPGVPGNGFQEINELAIVIRRYTRLPNGRVRLTPINDDYSSWTEGELTQYGLLDIWIVGVAVPHAGILIDPKSDRVLFVRKSGPTT